MINGIRILIDIGDAHNVVTNVIQNFQKIVDVPPTMKESSGIMTKTANVSAQDVIRSGMDKVQKYARIINIYNKTSSSSFSFQASRRQHDEAGKGRFVNRSKIQTY